MGMSNCFSNTALSHELANALSASAGHLQELQAAESQQQQQPQPQQPNPFQEASTFYPPITSQPSAHNLVSSPVRMGLAHTRADDPGWCCIISAAVLLIGQV